jgi:hypothetical protein
VASRIAATLAAECAWTGDLRGSNTTLARCGKCEAPKLKLSSSNHPADSRPSIEHLRENLSAATLPLSPEVIADLDSIGTASH